MKKSKVCIGLVNPKNSVNVGTAMRALSNYGINSVFYTDTRYLRAVVCGQVCHGGKFRETTQSERTSRR